MYLKNALILESGPIKDLELKFEFTENDNPKPMVIVGKNGSGKSNFLSFVTDALIEIAVKKFDDVAPPHPSASMRHQWHRMIGGSTIRTGSEFELALLKFAEGAEIHTYVSKGGTLAKADVDDRLGDFPGVNWTEDGSLKRVVGPDASIEEIFREGCYASFPTGRGEEAYWSGRTGESDTSIFVDRFQNKLRKPISLKSTLRDFRPWLVDVLLDSTIDVSALVQILNLPEPQQVQQIHELANIAAQNTLQLQSANALLCAILGVPNARLVRVGRHAGSGKLRVFDGQQPLLPGLDAFSAGQAMLIGIFGTILRYSDGRPGPKPTQEMQGIVVVDEIDAHLHADLQHEVLPRLMKLFPKVQFIVTAHAPLFPLGMEKAFGAGGFTLMEFPHGTQITAERFSEFLSSFEYLKKTKSFDDLVIKKATDLERPLVLCEGQTDPKYLRTAAQLLGFDDVHLGVDFDWVGVLANGQAKDGGENQLRQARKTLQNNPSFLRFRTILLFDCDQNDPAIDDGLLHVRVLARNDENERCDRGIENLLPSDVLDDDFFTESMTKNGANETRKRILNKVQLCDHLCDAKRDPDDFEGFRPALEMIQACLFPAMNEGTGDEPE